MKIKSSNGRDVATAEIWVDASVRSVAVERAKEETKRISRKQESERQKKELLVIANIRRDRIAKSQVGVRRRLIGVGVAVGIICMGAGYLIGSISSRTVQRHVVTKEDQLLVAQASASTAPPSPTVAKQEPLPAAVAATTQASTSTSAITSIPAAAVSPVIQVSAVAIGSGELSPRKLPQTNAVAVAARPSKRVLEVPGRATNVTMIGTDTPLPKPGQAPAEDAGVVLSKSRVPDPSAQPQAVNGTSVTGAATGLNEFSVVNLIEGTVVVRQGRAVRQIKIGEKMPDGFILKSVDVETGKFLTSTN